jgi:hypothetical protein
MALPDEAPPPAPADSPETKDCNFMLSAQSPNFPPP